MSDIQTTPADDNVTAPAPGSPEARAAAVAATVDRQAEQTGAKPDGLPDKFWDAENNRVNVEALIKSYTEAERALHGRAPKQEQAPAPTTEQTQPGEKADKLTIEKPATPAPGQVSEADFLKFGDEIRANGALSEDSYKALEAKGLPRAMVDSYVAGQQALAAQARNEIFGAAGGEDKYVSMIRWAGANLKDDEQAWFNKAIESDLVNAKRAVEWLSSKFVTANGQAPNFVNAGASSSTAGATPFADARERVAMRSDPKFAKDPAFRAKYEARMKATLASMRS